MQKLTHFVHTTLFGAVLGQEWMVLHQQRTSIVKLVPQTSRRVKQSQLNVYLAIHVGGGGSLKMKKGGLAAKEGTNRKKLEVVLKLRFRYLTVKFHQSPISMRGITSCAVPLQQD